MDKDVIEKEQEVSASKPEKKKKKPLWIAIFTISILLCIGCIIYIIMVLWPSDDVDDLASKVKKPILTEDNKPDADTKNVKNPIDFDKLRKINKDIVAWIKIDDTNIDYPVLRAPSNDQEYYLHRDYKKNYLFAGSIYMESYNKADFSDRDTILYGHNMANGSMFAHLHKFEDTDFFSKHSTYHIYTPDSIKTYKVYSAYEYDNRHINNSFKHFVDDDVFQEYIDYSLKPTSAILSNVRKGSKVTIDDKLVTLSTCTNNRPQNRYLVQGVLIKDEPTD
ncbi:MAG: class B sortase [Ruminococcus sp.]|nr:class B sortase [Ruminococcus sp.]